MVFNQKTHAIAQVGIDMRKAWCIGLNDDPQARVVDIFELGVKAQGVVAQAAQMGQCGIQHSLRVLFDQRTCAIVRRDRHRNVVPKSQTIGDMQIQGRQRVPLLNQSQHGTHFVRL